MKRAGNLYEQIYNIHNLELADHKARRRKRRTYGVRHFDRNRDHNLFSLQNMLIDGTFRTSPYTTFPVYEPKERLVFRLPYYPDRICHHAIMNILEPIWMKVFTADTYSCIKGRGILGAAKAIKRALRDEAGTKYCLKLDIKKFYPTIDHDILKAIIRRKFKDRALLRLLDGIIDSADGLPIGNYLSQYFANLYLTYFDHWLKEVKGVRYYFRYCDDLVFLAATKEELHQLLAEIRLYLAMNLKLEIKKNYQVFPVESRGIDFVGYVFRHHFTRLRKSIKINFARKMARSPNLKSIASYYGWTKHCNGRHLFKKLTYEKVRRHGDHAGFQKLHRRQDRHDGYP